MTRHNQTHTAPVLLVDDHPRSNEVLGRLLVRQGYRVAFAASGEDALNTLADEPFAAVLSDIELPRMNGLELLVNIQQRWPKIPVILMTAFDVDERRDTARAWGAAALLRKPVNGAQLAKAIRAARRPTAPARAPGRMTQRA